MRHKDKQGVTSEDQNTSQNSKDPVSLNLEEKWQEVKADYQNKYPMLTQKDLELQPGQFGDMADRIASKTQRCRSTVSIEIRYWNTGLLP